MRLVHQLGSSPNLNLVFTLGSRRSPEKNIHQSNGTYWIHKKNQNNMNGKNICLHLSGENLLDVIKAEIGLKKRSLNAKMLSMKRLRLQKAQLFWLQLQGRETCWGLQMRTIIGEKGAKSGWKLRRMKPLSVQGKDVDFLFCWKVHEAVLPLPSWLSEFWQYLHHQPRVKICCLLVLQKLRIELLSKRNWEKWKHFKSSTKMRRLGKIVLFSWNS